VCKRGDRSAALQPVAEGLLKHFGGLEAEGWAAGRRCAWATAHNTSLITSAARSDSGAEASYAFIEQPQTNGVAERFFRKVREQIIYGHIYRTVAEVREASGARQRPARHGTLKRFRGSPLRQIRVHVSPRATCTATHRVVKELAVCN
jgi:hypothetical protein